MDPITLLSGAEQVAGHLREALLRGELSGTIPGVRPLAAELEVNHKTVEVALNLLQDEGLLVDQGPGRKRKIVLPENSSPPALRVAILNYDPPEQTEQWMVAMQQQLLNQGHSAFLVGKPLSELGMDMRRVTRLVKRTPADAWVVCAASHEVLEWFSQQKTPAFALFGGFRRLSIAATGPDKTPAFAETTRRLVGLGHRRISFLCHPDIRLPQPVKPLRAFLDELEAAGISTGTFNLPDWDGSREDFERVLDSLFRTTPPTALIFDEPHQFHAAFHHLARRGLRVPEDVSLVCADPDPSFNWCQPSVAHIRWDYRAVVRRIVRWVNHVAGGKEDRRQSLTKTEFVEGGTMGPAS